MAIQSLTSNDWTVFYDKYSHGFKKTQYEAIFVNETRDKALSKLKETLSLSSNKLFFNSFNNYYASYAEDNLYQVSKYFFEKENIYYGPCDLENFFSSKKYLFICDKNSSELISEYNYSQNLKNNIAL